ncbi:hypothetical protein DUI87_12639 [Hirundo rustica rustica]|uniref:Uncharacterized protein n=1 Tax=Hirundo rustica rustica TaxID=333673 RepID=A0A3M0KCI4_HIRRU|nr:hypothetical protein DUI87_12639 [Hirundo rustica rustica]
MDRVSSTMKQVSNPLPKVLSRRAGGGGPEAERESFERAQVEVELVCSWNLLAPCVSSSPMSLEFSQAPPETHGFPGGAEWKGQWSSSTYSPHRYKLDFIFLI